MYRRKGVGFLLLVLSSVSLACGDRGSSSGAAATGSTGTSGAATGDIKLQINGEEAGYSGIDFPEGGIVDGWALSFDHVLVSFDKITLSENPDKSPSDQSQTDADVAELDGPWVADLAIAGSENGADGASKAVLIDRLQNQNKNGGKPFDATKRYAFSYQSVLASASAKKLNLDADGETYLAKMVGKYSVMYVGTATWKGDSSCKSSIAGYYTDAFPTTVKFELGFATPTRYINCQNQNNAGEPFAGENYQRGIPIVPNGDAIAQITIHLDHVMYDDVSHDAALFFDQFAATRVGKAPGGILHTEDLKGLDPSALTDGAGKPLPWRTCDGSDLPGSGQRSVETGSVPVNPSATPDKALRDYYDFVQYVQSTQGHLNGGDGLCFVKRDPVLYPSPP